MKKFLFVSIATAAFFSTSAFAADLPVKGPVYAPVAQMFDWSGFYVGGQVGYEWGHVRSDNISAGNVTTYNLNGALGGGHLGVNWQNGPWVFGLEGDINADSVKGDDGGFGGIVDKTKLRSEESARIRIGYAVDNRLFYVTGGGAWAQSTQTRVAIAPVKLTYSGWTVGAGFSVALPANWIWSLEYRYTDYGDKTFVTGDTMNTDPKTQQVTLRVSYLFATGGKGPVVAKY